MERDFLGLSDKQYLSNVKREAGDDRVGELGSCSCLSTKACLLISSKRVVFK